MSDLPARFLHRRVMNMVARGVIESSNDNSGIQRQDLSLLYEEGKDAVERFQNYGFSSHPKRGSEAITVFFGGGRDHGIILACDDRTFRIRGLGEGEVAIYSDEGDTIILKRNNVMEVTTKTLNVKAETVVNLQSPSVTIAGVDGAAGSVTVTGNLTVSQTIQADTVNAPHGQVGGTREERD
jgi:phage baseplate assembly protein V